MAIMVCGVDTVVFEGYQGRMEGPLVVLSPACQMLLIEVLYWCEDTVTAWFRFSSKYCKSLHFMQI